MPELPEVETVRLGLAPVLVGNSFASVEQRRHDLRFPLPKHFAVRLRGRTVDALDRRAKYLLARLDDGDASLESAATANNLPQWWSTSSPRPANPCKSAPG